MVDSKEFQRRRAIADEIKRNKEIRRSKHTTRTSFKIGQIVPGAGRKKGSKSDPKRKMIRQWKARFEEVMAQLVLSIQDEDFDTLTVKEKLNLIPSMAKFFISEKKAVETKETQIRKIEVSFSNEFNDSSIIDISPVQNLIEDNENEMYD